MLQPREDVAVGILIHGVPKKKTILAYTGHCLKIKFGLEFIEEKKVL
jgi:hypothetical protein